MIIKLEMKHNIKLDKFCKRIITQKLKNFMTKRVKSIRLITQRRGAEFFGSGLKTDQYLCHNMCD